MFRNDFPAEGEVVLSKKMPAFPHNPRHTTGAHAFDEDEVEAIVRNPKCKKALREAEADRIRENVL